LKVRKVRKEKKKKRKEKKRKEKKEITPLRDKVVIGYNHDDSDQ